MDLISKIAPVDVIGPKGYRYGRCGGEGGKEGPGKTNGRRKNDINKQEA